MCDICKHDPCLTRCPNSRAESYPACDWCGKSIDEGSEPRADFDGLHFFCSNHCAAQFFTDEIDLEDYRE